MAIHPNLRSMLKESLDEITAIASYSAQTRKPGGGGVYGFPSAMLLFSFIDTIGSFLRGNKNVAIQIDGATRSINRDTEHYFVLNSRFFDFSFSQKQIDFIYEMCRCKLLHNSVIGKKIILVPSLSPAIQFNYSNANKTKIETCKIGIRELLEKCETAKALFLSEIDDILKESRQVKDKAIQW
jgi:hypothetical protein